MVLLWFCMGLILTSPNSNVLCLMSLQVSFSDACIMSSCIRPSVQGKTTSVVLLHGFDRCVYPLLEEAGIESWAADILGWSFSNLEWLPSCDVASKRDHLYQIGRLHCLFPSWRGATLSFMASGGYKVTSLIKQVKQRALIIGGEDDQIISYKLAHGELAMAFGDLLREMWSSGGQQSHHAILKGNLLALLSNSVGIISMILRRFHGN
ncbi:alpha/beta hydrolase domain-containing protein VTE7-like isoform X2 [Beta vulgaris subsp. vulgaris]|uniref:alpha/beta hydrolase domain-containing protein VTE7-like isoform X2 n=1 Tax=Beta vulgaris subsp. vulgaris TaxID=3555 RepID=UPI00254686D6|nr:alpha/beta hydrolase domain-containing protein VTE7-like isoform X2 [Beta vulgaris subsp. vulgaris]